MNPIKDHINIINVSTDNITEAGIFCIRDKRSPGYCSKVEWVRSNLENGLRIKIATDLNNKQLGYIEYIPSGFSWRPVRAINYMFIHCILIFLNEYKGKGLGSYLLEICEKDAKDSVLSGICAVTSDGPWMADRTLFENNGYTLAGRKDRFELMVKTFNPAAPEPVFYDWTKQQAKYKGWNLVYSGQCPWHEKSVNDLKSWALSNNIDLKITRLKTPADVRKAPSGTGTFALLKDGKLLEDHYISRKRFENIVRNLATRE